MPSSVLQAAAMVARHEQRSPGWCDHMTIWQYDNMTICRYDHMTIWPYDHMTKWQYEDMTSSLEPESKTCEIMTLFPIFSIGDQSRKIRELIRVDQFTTSSRLVQSYQSYLAVISVISRSHVSHMSHLTRPWDKTGATCAPRPAPAPGPVQDTSESSGQHYLSTQRETHTSL